MRKKLFLTKLAFMVILLYSPQILASSDFTGDSPLLTGQSKTQILISSSEKSDIVLGPNIVKYMDYCARYKINCNLSEVLWQLEQYKHKRNSFSVTASVSLHIPEQFIDGMFKDFQNPAISNFIKTLFEQSEEQETETAKIATTVKKTPTMDITFISSDGSSSSTVASVMTSQLETALSESCATTYDSQLRQRKTAQSTSPTIPSH